MTDSTTKLPNKKYCVVWVTFSDQVLKNPFEPSVDVQTIGFETPQDGHTYKMYLKHILIAFKHLFNL